MTSLFHFWNPRQMINKEDIKGIVFSNYANYIKFAKLYSGKLKRVGVHPDELVNEAIIAIIDCKIKFEDESQITKFIQSAIKGISYSEYVESNKRSNESSNEDGEYLLTDIKDEVFEYGDSAYSQKSEALYDVVFNYRFPKDIDCPECGCKGAHGHSYGYQCRVCRTAFNVKTRTHLHHIRTPLSDIYKICERIIRDGFITKNSIKDLNIKQYSIILVKTINKIFFDNINIGAVDLMKALLEPIPNSDKKTYRKISTGWLSDKDSELIIKDYISGKTMQEISFVYNRSFNIIKRLLKSRGLIRKKKTQYEHKITRDTRYANGSSGMQPIVMMIRKIDLLNKKIT